MQNINHDSCVNILKCLRLLSRLLRLSPYRNDPMQSSINQAINDITSYDVFTNGYFGEQLTIPFD